MIKTLDTLLIDRVFQHYVDIGKNPYDLAAFFFEGSLVLSLACLVYMPFAFLSVLLIILGFFAASSAYTSFMLKKIVSTNRHTEIIRQDTRAIRFRFLLAVVLSHVFIVLPPLPMMFLQFALAAYWVGLNMMGCRLPAPSAPPPPSNPWVA